LVRKEETRRSNEVGQVKTEIICIQHDENTRWKREVKCAEVDVMDGWSIRKRKEMMWLSETKAKERR
jgi:hypothetical protein